MKRLQENLRISLESIMQIAFNPNQYVKNAEVIKGSKRELNLFLKMPEGLLLPIDAKFPSGLTLSDSIDLQMKD